MFFGIYLFLFSQEPTCSHDALATRKGRDLCWVQYSLSKNKKICVTRLTWHRWIYTSNPPFFCETDTLPWKDIAPPQNNPNLVKKESFKIQIWKNLPSHPLLKIQGVFPSCIQTIEKLREKISFLLDKKDPIGLLRKLILNENTENNPLAVLRRIGFVHLTSASGVHLYALKYWIDFFLKFLWTKINYSLFNQWLQLGLWISRILFLVIGSFVWILAGARIGMLRPIFIIISREIASILGYRWGRFSPLLVSIIIESFIAFISQKNFSLGRLTYALAVGGGILWHESFLRTKGNKLSTHLKAHLGLAIGSWVLVAFLEIIENNTVALFTPIISLITLPFFCIVFYPVLLVSIVLNGVLLEKTIYFQTFFLEKMIYFALLPGNLWIVSKNNLILGCALSSFLFLFNLFIPTSFFKRTFLKVFVLFLIKISILIVQIFFHPINSSNVAKSVDQLDVGQGDSALVEQAFSKQYGLIDTGSQKSISDDGWIQIFAHRKISKISWISLSHLDEDHSGGLLRLIQLIPIECLFISEAELESNRGIHFLKKLRKNKIRITSHASDCIPFPSFSVFPKHKKNEKNAFMTALLIPFQYHGFYFTAGDASQKDEILIFRFFEKWIQQHHPFLLETSPRILKISHHGSKSSTSDEILKKIKPTEAWISVGKNNIYRHPSEKVIKKLNSFKIHIKTTEKIGHIYQSAFK